GVDRFPLGVVGDRLLTCSRGASAIPIAEWVLAQMLAFEKELPAVWLREFPSSWNFRPTMGGLYGKTLGLVGIRHRARRRRARPALRHARACLSPARGAEPARRRRARDVARRPRRHGGSPRAGRA